MTLPMLAAMEATVVFIVFDFLVATLLLAFIIIETISDKQQMTFQTTKYKLLKQGKTLEDLLIPYNKGFNTQGLWSRSRHPNYLSEHSIWVALYFFCITAGVTNYIFFNWTLIGSMLLILLFMGSSAFSESISLQKYPAYQGYINEVFKYLPLRKNKN